MPDERVAFVVPFIASFECADQRSGVIADHVKIHAYSHVVCFRDQPAQIIHGAETGIQLLEMLNPVAVKRAVDIGLHRGQPDRVDPECLEVRKPPLDSGEITPLHRERPAVVDPAAGVVVARITVIEAVHQQQVHVQHVAVGQARRGFLVQQCADHRRRNYDGGEEDGAAETCSHGTSMRQDLEELW